MGILKRKRICVEKDGAIYKITSIYLLKDGSFKIDIPYCPFSEGSITKYAPKYGTRSYTITKQELKLDLKVSKRPQLSMHVSGFVQFSGPGIRSGIDPNTDIARGVGVYSSPLTTPIRSGPTSIFVIWGLESFDTTTTLSKEDILIKYEDFYAQIGTSGKKRAEDVDFNSLAFHLFVFPEEYQDKIVESSSGEKMNLHLPNYQDEDDGVVGKTFVFSICRLHTISSFLGILPFKLWTGFPDKAPFGFELGSPSGLDTPIRAPRIATIYRIQDLEDLKKQYERNHFVVSSIKESPDDDDKDSLDYVADNQAKP